MLKYAIVRPRRNQEEEFPSTNNDEDHAMNIHQVSPSKERKYQHQVYCNIVLHPNSESSPSLDSLTKTIPRRHKSTAKNRQLPHTLQRTGSQSTSPGVHWGSTWVHTFEREENSKHLSDSHEKLNHIDNNNIGERLEPPVGFNNKDFSLPDYSSNSPDSFQPYELPARYFALVESKSDQLDDKPTEAMNLQRHSFDFYSNKTTCDYRTKWPSSSMSKTPNNNTAKLQDGNLSSRQLLPDKMRCGVFEVDRCGAALVAASHAPNRQRVSIESNYSSSSPIISPCSTNSITSSLDNRLSQGLLSLTASTKQSTIKSPHRISLNCSSGSASTLSSNDSKSTSNLCKRLNHLRRECRAKILKESSEFSNSSEKCNPISKSSSITSLYHPDVIDVNKCKKVHDINIMEAESESLFGYLSASLLARVFDNLSNPADRCRCARVCKRWYTVAWDPTLWTCLRMDLSVSSNQNASISSSVPNVSLGLQAITKILSYASYPVCLCVESIVLTNCSTLTDKGVKAVAQLCSELRYLDISGCSKVTNMALIDILSNCHNLEVLIASGCSQISCLSVAPSRPATPCSPNRENSSHTLSSGINGLRNLALRYLDLSECPRLDDAGICMLVPLCPDLSRLFLRKCPLVGDTALDWVATSCPVLRQVSFNHCQRISDRGVDKLMTQLGRSLRHLSLAKCSQLSDAVVNSVASNCHRLRYLNVRGCPLITDASLEKLAASPVTTLRLQCLDIGGCDVTDDTLSALAAHATQLTQLGMRGCDAITDLGLVRLFQGTPGTTLVRVDVSGTAVTKETCRWLWTHGVSRCIIDDGRSDESHSLENDKCQTMEV